MSKLKKYKVQKKYYRVEECIVMAKDREDAKDRVWCDIVSEGIDSSGESISSALLWDYIDDTLDIEVEKCRGVFV